MHDNSLASPLPVHAPGRKASWFELFFDLVFVVAVAQLAGSFAHHYDAAGSIVFAFSFLVMWWCWLGHTFFTTRFDDGSRQLRWLGLAKVLAVAWMAYGASDPDGERSWAFASGVAGFKILLALAYMMSWRWQGARGLIRSYAGIYLAQSALWAGSLAFPESSRWLLWSSALLLDLLTPWLVARFTYQFPPHHEHLPERFGLFTIILLGEGIAASVHALDHNAILTANSVIAASGAALLTFMVWVGYFERSRAQQEREVVDAHSGADLRLWAYAHVGLYLGLAGLAAGTVHAAGVEFLNSSAQWLLAMSVILVMLSLTLLGAASRDRTQRWRPTVPHFVIVALFLALTGYVDFSSTLLLYLVLAAAFLIQLVLAKVKGIEP